MPLDEAQGPEQLLLRSHEMGGEGYGPGRRHASRA